jgi:hypothetical protein
MEHRMVSEAGEDIVIKVLGRNEPQRKSHTLGDGRIVACLDQCIEH